MSEAGVDPNSLIAGIRRTDPSREIGLPRTCHWLESGRPSFGDRTLRGGRRFELDLSSDCLSPRSPLPRRADASPPPCERGSVYPTIFHRVCACRPWRCSTPFKYWPGIGHVRTVRLTHAPHTSLPFIAPLWTCTASSAISSYQPEC